MKLKLYLIFLLAITQFNVFSPTATHLNFDGVNDQVDLGNTLTTHFTGKNTITLEAWVKPSTNTGFGSTVGNFNFPSNSGMQMLPRRDGTTYTF